MNPSQQIHPAGTRRLSDAVRHFLPGLLAVTAVLLMAMPAAHAAKVALRLHSDDGQYSGFPDSYPVCKSRMDYMHFDGTPTAPKRDLFNTKTGWIEIGVYQVGGFFDGSEVVGRLRTYESNGMEVAGVSLYREDWLATDTPGGEYPIDWRILSTTEIAAVRNAIATADPPLRCRDTLKVIQLLGSGSGAWGAGSAQNFPIMPASVKEHLKLFDGVGVECHIGDHEAGDRQSVTIAMAAISRWCADNSKTAFVFMGGGARTYEDLPRTQLTFRYLWSEMLKQGVDYRADNVVYFRQGAWPDGKHTPEAAFDTLTHQQRWLINTVNPLPGSPVTSLFVSEVQDQTINVDASGTVRFFVGEAEKEADQLAVSAISSNQALVSNSNLRISGRGLERALSIVPNALQSGSATITLTVNDGLVSMSTSFLLTVTPAVNTTAAAGGSINDPATWGVPLPVPGDSNIWHTGNKAINMTALATDTFQGGTFEVETGGQLNPGVPVANLFLKNLVLDGGTISMSNNSGLDIDLGGNRFLLNSGTLKTGVAASMRVVFQSGLLAGDGTVNVTSAGTGGANVEFRDSISTLGFSGKFSVSSNGILNLPMIPVDNASFGLILSGSGKYQNNQDVALTSLVISGNTVAPGSYTYADFVSMGLQSYFVSMAGTITVISNTPPTLGVLPDQTTDEDTAVVIPFTVGDSQTAAGSLTVSGFSSDTDLVPNASFTFGGSSSNRIVTITPASNRNGSASVSIVVNDGWFTTTRSFSLGVNPVNDAPVISSIPDRSLTEDSSLVIPFVIGDVETPAGSLSVTVASSNTDCMPNADLLLAGNDANRTLALTSRAFHPGQTQITLSVGDGVNTTVRSFLVTVTPAGSVDASLSGPINAPGTWGVPVPVAGDGNFWKTGAKSISMALDTETFYGKTLVLQPGGTFAPGLPTANLTLNNLILSGGTIATGNNNGVNLDLGGKTFTLDSGILRAGGVNTGRDVRFKNGSLAGSGVIDIIAAGFLATDPPDVEFQATVATKGFTGFFNIHDGGVLNLSAISGADASFGVILSGTGRYTNDANVTLSSLRIAGNPVAPGTYAYSAFSPAQQAFLVKTTGVITVLALPANIPPTLSGLPGSLQLAVNTQSSPIGMTIGDLETPAASLVVTAVADAHDLIPPSGLQIGGTGAARSLTVTPVANRLGSATITVTVGDGAASTTGTFVVTVGGSAAEVWRFSHFGTTAENSNSMGTADPDSDGENNLLEFATGQDPHAGAVARTSVSVAGGGLEFIYPRSISAMNGGVTYSPVWSDTLVSEGWTPAGSPEQVISTEGDNQTVKTTIPLGAGGHRFVRLRVVGH